VTKVGWERSARFLLVFAIARTPVSASMEIASARMEGSEATAKVPSARMTATNSTRVAFATRQLVLARVPRRLEVQIVRTSRAPTNVRNAVCATI